MLTVLKMWEPLLSSSYGAPDCFAIWWMASWWERMWEGEITQWDRKPERDSVARLVFYNYLFSQKLTHWMIAALILSKGSILKDLTTFSRPHLLKLPLSLHHHIRDKVSSRRIFEGQTIAKIIADVCCVPGPRPCFPSTSLSRWRITKVFQNREPW